ncbi:MAG: PhzF family phenazine biosynthesis protein [Bacillota bacterium]
MLKEVKKKITAFLVQEKGGFNLRWFTPNSEVDLCGHATLASAHVLWEKGILPKEQIAEFYTKSGVLTAKIAEGWIDMNFPATPEKETKPPAALLNALKVNPLYVGKNIFDYIVEVENEEIVKDINPDFAALLEVPMRGVIVTARSKEYDFVSRFFAPSVGINEDPVTGSAHCCLAPYWKRKLEKDLFIAYQVSERGGILKVQSIGERVIISGKAITVLEGELLY